jgi:hypothetical protein
MQSTAENRPDRSAIGAKGIHGADGSDAADSDRSVASVRYANDNADLVRGMVMALGLVGLCLGAVILIAHHGRLHARDVFDGVVGFVAPSPLPPPKPVKKRPVPAGTDAPLANPSAGGGPSPDGAGGTAPVANASPDYGPAPATAAQALRQVLHNFRGDPKGTATITISSSGKIAQGPPGPLTHDELPIEALDGAAMITGATPARRAP